MDETDRVMVVEDDPTVLTVVGDYLRAGGFVVAQFTDGGTARDALETEIPDVIVLDRMLPTVSGDDLCRAVRRSHPGLPVIMLTALDSVDDRIHGLEFGADDYLPKPFSLRELQLRVEALLRRSRGTSSAAIPFAAGRFRVDPARRRIWVDDDEITLTTREYELALFFLQHPDQTFSRDDIMREVWGWSFGDASTVTVHVRRLREDRARATLSTTPHHRVGRRIPLRRDGQPMMLSGNDLWRIVEITALWTTIVTLVSLLVLRLNRRGSITSQFAVVVLATTAAIVCSTIAIASEMYVSHHDLQVLSWVVAIAAVASLAAAMLTGRAARSSVDALRESARRIGEGDVIDRDAGGWREFAEVSEQLAETSQRLAAARAEIERLDASRRQFFMWISHDLRTPLTGVRALAEALEVGIAEDPAEYTRRIRIQVDTMSRLVDDLFELSRVQSGTIPLRREAVDLRDILSDAVADVHHIADDRDVTIRQADLPDVTVWADPHGLTRVMVNILGNSVKYAPGHTAVTVAATAEDDHVVLEVIDDGPGVPAEDLEHMFEIGWRADSARTPGFPGGTTTSGSGLGLAVVRGIVEAHGGQVNADHASNGFRVTVVLPTAECHTLGQPREQTTTPQSRNDVD